MLSRWLTRLGIALGVVVVLLIVAAIAVFGLSERQLHKTYDIAPKRLAIPTDSASIERGAHLAQAIGMCVECHGENLQGQVVSDGPLGLIAARNLTRGTGGRGTMLTDADYVRAIRHGVAPDGRALMVMPSQDYTSFSDADLAAVIAYVKTMPPEDNVVPDSRLAPLGRALLVAGKLPLFSAERIDHTAPSPAPVPVGGTKEYGAYIARIACKGCHGPEYAGGPVLTGDPSWPPASNLTVSGPTKSWNEADFIRLMRTGRRPDSVPVNAAMPWKSAGRMTDEELHAVWSYLRSIPGRETGASGSSASVNATMSAVTDARATLAYFTWLIAQVQKITSSGLMPPPDDNRASE